MPSEEPGSRPAERAIFNALGGKWSLARTIPGRGAMTGIARFEPKSSTVLHYFEEGRLALTSGQAVRVWREHYYSLEPAGIRIAFAQGAEPGGTLHRLRLTTSGNRPWPAEASDVYSCGADTYAGHYRFETRGRITITMLVRGPRKGYAIHSTLDRA